MFTCLVIYKIIRFSFKSVKQYISPKAQTVFKLFFAFRSFVDFGVSSLGIEYFISVLDFFFLLIATSAHVLMNSTILVMVQRNNVGLTASGYNADLKVWRMHFRISLSIYKRPSHIKLDRMLDL